MIKGRNTGSWTLRGIGLLPAVLISVFAMLSCEDLLPDPDGNISREMLEDTWKVEESGGNYKSTEEVYWVEMFPHPTDTSRIIIYNFYNVDADAEAVLNGRTLQLPTQVLEGGYSVSGSGQILGNKANQINWTYAVDDGSGELVNISAVYTRLTF